MAVQQFCLRWNNHQPNFISVFSSLLNSESLVDVTLAAEGQHIQAHKVVLSACSTYFQSLFTMNPCQHPIVILKDIKYSDLKIMVDFMYCGEVNVSQDQLPAILKTAETLKIKGLTEMPEQNISLSKSISLSEKSCDSPTLRRKRLRKSSTGSGSGSGSTEHTGTVTGGSEETVGSVDVPVLPSSPTIKTEPSEGEGPLRHELSTESELDFTSHESVESQENIPPQVVNDVENDVKPDYKPDEIGPGSSTQPQTGAGWMYTEAGFPQKPMSHFHSQPTTAPRRKRAVNLREDDNFLRALEAVRYGNIGFCKAAKMFGVNNRTLWLEYKRRGYPILRPSKKQRSLSNSYNCTTDYCSSPVPVEPTTSVSMGSKRGRFLTRQHRIKKDCETEDISLSVPRVIERQSSEPGPSPSNSLHISHSPNLLTVPQPAYLVKQHSSPQILSSPPSTTTTPTFQVQIINPSETSLLLRPRSEELRRTASSPQCSSVSESSRSCHCPVLRPGPALGCNYCWNTIDAHGRILRRKTKYHCPECQTNLCIVPCFQEYHGRQGTGTNEANTNTSPAVVPTIMKTSSM